MNWRLSERSLLERQSVGHIRVTHSEGCHSERSVQTRVQSRVIRALVEAQVKRSVVGRSKNDFSKVFEDEFLPESDHEATRVLEPVFSVEVRVVAADDRFEDVVHANEQSVVRGQTRLLVGTLVACETGCIQCTCVHTVVVYMNMYMYITRYMYMGVSIWLFVLYRVHVHKNTV